MVLGNTRSLAGRCALFCVVYIGAILYLSLYPWEIISPPHTARLFWVSDYSRRIMLDFVLNVLLYVPLGAAAVVGLGRRMVSLPVAAAAGFAISFGVELTQRYIPLRAATFDDLAANTVGAALGAILALTWKKRFTDASLLTILWLVWNGFLLLRMINRSPWPAAGLDADFLWMGSVNAFLGFLALSLVLKPPAIMAVILALAPLVGLWIYPALLLSRLSATFGALALAHHGKPSIQRWLPSACLIWLAFQELYPLDFAGPPHPFSWIPFESLFSNRPHSYYPLVFGKLFFYTTIIWAVRVRARGLHWAFSLAGTVLLAGEFAQCFLPGRNPEMTDLVLMAAGALLLWLAEPAGGSCADGQAPAGVSHEVGRA